MARNSGASHTSKQLQQHSHSQQRPHRVARQHEQREGAVDVRAFCDALYQRGVAARQCAAATRMIPWGA